MKFSSIRFAAFSAAVLFETITAAPAASVGTLTWVGASTGGDWGNTANWSTDSASYTVAQLLALGSGADGATYDLSALANGATLTLNRSSSYAGVAAAVAASGKSITLEVRGMSRAKFQSNAAWPGAVKLSMGAVEVAAGGLSSDAQIVHAGEGSFKLLGDQTLASLTKGDSGSLIDFAGTLTIAPASGRCDAYAGRLDGAGSFVKSGAGEFIYSGQGFWSGTTTVSDGTLTLSAPLRRDGLVLAYRFEDPSNPGAAEGPASQPNEVKRGSVTSIAGHRPGSKAIQFPDGSSNNSYLSWVNTGCADAGGYLPSGDEDFTVSFWFKPSQDTGRISQILFYGTWDGSDSNFRHLHLKFNRNATYSDRYAIALQCGDFQGDNYWAGGCTVYADGGQAKFFDGNWHQVVITHGGGALKMYVDGQLGGDDPTKAVKQNVVLNLPTGRNPWILGYESDTSSNWSTYHYAGGLDDFLVYDRCLSADEIARDYESGLPDGGAAAAAPMPQPVAHWAFDDTSMKGRDTGPYGYHLTAKWNGMNGPGFNIYGNAEKGDIYKLSDATFPEHFPTGNSPFTVSVRWWYTADENKPLIRWGGSSDYTHIQVDSIGSDNNGCYDRAEVGSSWSATKWVELYDERFRRGQADPHGIHHVVYVWDPVSQRIAGYRADRFIKANNLGRALDLTPENLKINGNNYDSGSGSLWARIDDIQVYDKALSVAQIRTLVRSLDSRAAGSTLPPTTAVTVASGATLAVDGAGHACDSLNGAGSLLLGPGASLAVSNGGTFSGAAAGTGMLRATGGTLALTGNGSAFAGTVLTTNAAVSLSASYACDAYVLPGSALSAAGAVDATLADGATWTMDPYAPPIAATQGDVTVPASGVLNLTDSATVPVILASGATVTAADGIAGWTAVRNGDPVEGRFRLTSDAFKFSPLCGTTVFIR